MSKHIAVWIDHKEARIYHVRPDGVEETLFTRPEHIHHGPPKAPESVKSTPEEAKRFFHEVGRSLDGAKEILVVGPSTAKLEFLRYMRKHDREIEPRIVGVETVEHPTDGQLAAYTRQYFHPKD